MKYLWHSRHLRFPPNFEKKEVRHYFPDFRLFSRDLKILLCRMVQFSYLTDFSKKVQLTPEIPRYFNQHKHPKGSFDPLMSLPISSIRLLVFLCLCVMDTLWGFLRDIIDEKNCSRYKIQPIHYMKCEISSILKIKKFDKHWNYQDLLTFQVKSWVGLDVFYP